MQNQESIVRHSPLLIRLTGEQLDRLPWAIAKVDRQGVFSYGNRAMCELAGVGSIEGMTIEDMFRDNDLAEVRKHLASRFTVGVADEYEVDAIRTGVRVPIRVSAMPDIDDLGDVVGAIAIVRDLLAEDVSANVNKAVQDLRNGRDILWTIATECERLVPFDIFSVTLYSEDGEHARTFYLYPEGVFRPSVRWQEMTSYAKALVNAKEVLNVADFEEWLDRPEWRAYRDEPDMQLALKMGFRSSVSFPVISGNRVVATVGFSRKRDKAPFDKHDEERLGGLPLSGAVRMALHYQKVDELEFALALVRKIASGPDDTGFIAETLIEEIAKHYDWENVSIFRADEQQSQLCLVRQQARKESFALPDGWHHPIDQGITGRVFRTGVAINVADVTAQEFVGQYLPVYPESRSELCIPILVAGRVYWILNIEDSKRNAFAKEEQEALESVLREVAVVLDLVSKNQVFTELLKHSKDAVIQTDLQGIIVQTNPAAEELLGYKDAEMKGRPFISFFLDGNQARRVEESEYVPNDEVHLRHRDGSEVSLLLSGTSLPKEIGLKIYVCNDLSTRKRMETLEILRHMYNEIASQIKTPLSLVFTWLDKLRESEPRPEVADMLAKTVKQLNKVDLCYDRLLFYERHKSIAPLEKRVFEIPVLIEEIKQQMPSSEAIRIEVESGADVPLVRADLFQVWFCVESVLAYLLRFVPDSGKISVGVRALNGRAVVDIRGHAPPVTGGEIKDYASARWAIHAITEMALGEAIIKGFIERNHGGRFRGRRMGGNMMEYVIELPGA